MHTCAQYGRDRELCQKRNIPAKLDEHLSKALNLGEATEHDDGVLISRGLVVEAPQDYLKRVFENVHYLSSCKNSRRDAWSPQ